MPLDIKVKTFGMAREQEQLDEISDKIKSSHKGDILIFPEYAAYTLEGSQKAFAELSKMSSDNGLSIITTLNLPSPDLPGADPNLNYNTLFIFSRNGEVYSPQAKITPQSFEMRHLDESFPKMNVASYSYLNKVTLRVNGESFTAFFFICSDLYVLPMFDFRELASDIICCPANFGNGAESAAGRVIKYSVQSGLFNQGFYCNTYQNAKRDLIPLTVGFERAYETRTAGTSYDKEEMKQRVRKASAVYPDDEYCNFKSMLKLTRQGTFTVPKSRSLENGLEVHLGRYETLVEL
ncbi:MAG: hypothetical protein O6857_05935 [Nitrospinae bacterium]|nr:hypothetical protein [Nitrospinota bacterium]